MIGLLALALQSASPDTALDTITATGFQTTTETQPMILYYQNCLAPPGVMMRPPTSGTAEARANARIAACADIRKWALSTGISVYRAECGGDPDATHFMNTSLDQVDRGFLAEGRFTDAFISGKIKPADLNGQQRRQPTPDGADATHE